MPRALYSDASLVDIDSILAQIWNDNPDVGERFFSSLETTISHLERFPKLGEHFPHPDYDDLRTILVGKFKNYIIFYSIEANDRIVIVRVLDGRRDIHTALRK